MKNTENLNEQTENRFMAVETKLAYLEDFVNKMQEEVVSQQKTIENLRIENKILSGRIQDISDNLEIPNSKPPHY